MKRWLRIGMIGVIICLGTLLCAYADCPQRKNEDFIVMRRNMIANDIAGIAPDAVYNEASNYIRTLQEDGSWRDIDYDTQPTTTHPAMAHVDRLRVIARAYSIPNQPLYESQEAVDAIERALPTIESRMLKLKDGGERLTPGNWWWWNLYLPPRLGFVLAVAEGHIEQTVFDTSVETIQWCLAHPLDWYLKGLKGQATNSTDAIKGNLYYAMLSKREEDVRWIVNEFSESMQKVERPYEGITQDGGYIAHNMVDFYGYFGTFVLDSIRVLDYLKDTSFLPPAEVTDVFAACLCEGASWAMYQDYRELSASGRSMHGPFTKEQTDSIRYGLEFIASQPGIYQARAKELLNRRKSGYEMHVGHRYFYNGDFTVHKTDESYVSLRTSSTRTVGGEAWGGNGQTNTYMGDGCMWIYHDAKKVYDSSALACMDWDRLAGTTVLDQYPREKFRSYWMVAEPFVGGVSDGEYGVSAMNMAQISMPLSAQKSWFFFDDEVVCMGSAIQSEGEHEAHTIIDQRENRGEALMVNGTKNTSGKKAEKILRDVRYIAYDDIGYYFPTQTDVALRKESRTGSWKRLSGSRSDTELHADFTSFYLNHGKEADGQGYAYAVLPNITDEKLKTYANGENFEILENSDKIHAVRDVSTDSVGAVFWPDERDCLSLDRGSMEDNYADGIAALMVASTDTRTIGVKVKGENGAASASATYGAMGFAICEERLSGDVEIQIRWFDDAAAQNGSWWKLQYQTRDGVRSTKTVPYQYTDTWVTTTLTLEDAYFQGSGLIENTVELALVHSGSPIDTTREKYEMLFDYTMENITYDTTLYGPVVQSIRMYPLGRTASASYRASVAGIETDTPCIVYRKEEGGKTVLSVAEPTQRKDEMTLTLDGGYRLAKETEGVTLRREGTKTCVTIKPRGGQTYQITMEKDN